MREPRTEREWRIAVDAAANALSQWAAEEYGLVAGAPEVNVERCRDILVAGRARGIRPESGEAERTAERIIEAWRSDRAWDRGVGVHVPCDE